MLLFKILILFQAITHADTCPPGQYLVQGHTRKSHYKTDGTFVNSSQIPSYCKEFRIQKPFRINFLRHKPKGWPYSKEMIKAWTNSEKEKISQTLSELPALLTQIGDVHFIRLKESVFKGNPATTAPSENIISIYDDSCNYDLKRIVAHELSHILFNSLSKDEKESYYSSAKWLLQNGVFITTRTNLETLTQKKTLLTISNPIFLIKTN